MPRNKDCTDCDLHKTADRVCAWGDGPEDATIIVVGEAPGKQEVRNKVPFSGESGKILRSELNKNDLMEHTYFTNVVKCRPPSNRTPTPAEIKACKKYLDEEIAELDPEYVVTAGGVPTKTLFRGKAKINQFHGELIENGKVNYIGMPIFHPAYTLRDPSKTPGFQNDIRRLSEVFYGEESDSTVVWNVVRRGNLDEFLRQYMEAEEFSFDLETSGLFPYGDNDGPRYITAVGICFPDCAWIIPGWMHPDFQRYSSSPWVHGDALNKLIRFLCENQGNKKAYAQNGKFDNTWLHCLAGCQFRLDFDTMLAHHVLDENVHHDLTSLCRTYLHEPEYDIPLANKNGKSKKPGLNYKYCAQDCMYTLRLVKIFEKELEKNHLLHRLFYKLTMPAARAFSEIEPVGLWMDREQMKETAIDILSEKINVERKLNQLAGRDVNWDSPQQVGEILYRELGLPCRMRTAKGNPSTSEEAILDLKVVTYHEVVDLLIRYRELSKFHSTYIIGLKQYMVGNKLHISYKLHGTVTGRYSSRIHSIPRDKRIRGLVTAPEGWEFVQGDLNQAELRIIAHTADDPELKRCFIEGVDPHWRTMISELRSGGQGDYIPKVMETAEHYGVNYGRVERLEFEEACQILENMGPEEAVRIWEGWKEGRKKAKAVNFGYVYGMWAKRFIQTAKIKYGWEPTMAEAESSRSNFFQLYSRLESWHNKQKKLAKLDGGVRSLSGRLRRLPGIYAKDRGVRMEAERQSINAPIQGFIGDFKAMALVEIHETIDRGMLKVVGEHHDAILMMVKSEYKDEVLPEVLKIMAAPKLLKEFKINLKVPMESELDVGPWSKGKTYRV